MSTVLPVTGNTEQTAPENRAFYPALDGLRAIAFFMVFFEHYDHMPWGWAGVDLFFVLSGFLITGILFDTRDDRHRVRNFYVRRTLRIFPLYYGVMLAIIAATPLLHWEWNWRWLAWPLYVGNFARFIHPYGPNSALELLANFQPRGAFHGHYIVLYLGHFWSLCVEEQFYLVWPWLVFRIRDRRRLLWICAATLPLCLGARLLGQHFSPHWMLQNELLYRATPFRMDALLLGGFLTLMLRGPYAQRLLLLTRRIFPFVLCVVGLVFVFTPARHVLTRPYAYPTWVFTYGLTIADLLAALLILACLQKKSLTFRFFNLRPLRWLGRLTYGAYVLHDIPHVYYVHAAHRISAQHAEVTASALALLGTVILAWLSFKFVESPFLDLKERWTIRDADLAKSE